MLESTKSSALKKNIVVRPLGEEDLPVADRIMREAFGTFLGLPDPLTFMGDADYVRSRWRADPSGAFAAEIDGVVCGSNFATNWGSVGFFGPLTIRPDFWNQGVGKHLMEPVLERFDAWGSRHTGLFTFAQSPKHVGLYRKFGFYPRFLTAIMSKAVAQIVPTAQTARFSAARFSEVPEKEQSSTLDQVRALTDSIYEGLDVTAEMRSVYSQGLGDTVLLWNEGALVGVAICHCGPGTEAGSGSCYVKFGATRLQPGAALVFNCLLDACEAFAAQRGLSRLVAGVNTARQDAYQTMLERGFQTDIQGVAMHRYNDPGYNRSEVFLIDDWR